VEKYCSVGQAIDDNIIGACALHTGYQRLKAHTQKYVILIAFALRK